MGKRGEQEPLEHQALDRMAPKNEDKLTMDGNQEKG
jgi:hypothetical protein